MRSVENLCPLSYTTADTLITQRSQRQWNSVPFPLSSTPKEYMQTVV